MANFMYTDVAGTARRRAKRITIENPAPPNDPNAMTPSPVLKFDMEDRIVMADGSDQFIDVGELTVVLDNVIMQKQYPAINTETGVIDAENMRLGADIMSMIVDALEDVFITEASS